MPGFSSSGGGGGYDYVQSGEPTDAVEGEEWYDTDADSAYVFTGTAWVEQTVTDHGEVGNVQPGQHFNAGNALAFASGALDVQEGNIVYGNLSGTPNSTQSASTAALSGFYKDSKTNYINNPDTVKTNDDTASQPWYAENVDVTVSASTGYDAGAVVEVQAVNTDGSTTTYATQTVARGDTWSTTVQIEQPVLACQLYIDHESSGTECEYDASIQAREAFDTNHAHDM